MKTQFILRDDGVLVMSFSTGRLENMDGDTIAKLMWTLFAEDITGLVIDVSRLLHITWPGLRLLEETGRLCRTKGIKVVLFGPTSHMQHVGAILAVQRRFLCFDALADAMVATAPTGRTIVEHDSRAA